MRGYLAQHGMGDLSRLTAEEIAEACRIAAGWPTSVTGGPQGGDEVVDGEIVDPVDAQLVMDAEVVEEPEGGWL